MEEEELFPLETSMDGFFNFNSTGTEQECIMLQSDVGINDNTVQPEVGVDDNNDAILHNKPPLARSSRDPTKKRQRQGTTAWAAEQNKQFDRGRSQ